MNVDQLVLILAKARARPRYLGTHSRSDDGKASPDLNGFDCSALASDLEDLFWSTGLSDEVSEERAAWLELAPEVEPHAKLAAGFRRMGRASNPLSPKVCFGNLALKFRRKISSRCSRKFSRFNGGVPPISSIDWHALTSEEQQLIRTMAGELAAYHRGFVRAYRPTNDLLDTLLSQLAEIFVRYAAQDWDVLKLESAERSLFVQFCHAALAAFSGKRYALSEVSAASLSKRWVRYKRSRATLRAPATKRVWRSRRLRQNS